MRAVVQRAERCWGGTAQGGHRSLPGSCVPKPLCWPLSSVYSLRHKFFHIPPNYVVNRWLLSGEHRSLLDFPLTHNGRAKHWLQNNACNINTLNSTLAI